MSLLILGVIVLVGFFITLWKWNDKKNDKSKKDPKDDWK